MKYTLATVASALALAGCATEQTGPATEVAARCDASPPPAGSAIVPKTRCAQSDEERARAREQATGLRDNQNQRNSSTFPTLPSRKP